MKQTMKINTTVTIISKKSSYMKPTIKKTPKTSQQQQQQPKQPLPPPPEIKITCTDDDDDEDEYYEDYEDEERLYKTANMIDKITPKATTMNKSSQHPKRPVTNTVRRHRSRRCSSSDCNNNSNSYQHKENYSIDELDVDDETDDEDEPRKPIPKWAQTEAVLRRARKQACDCLDYASLFRASADTRIQLERVFPVVKTTFHVRSSSAEWVSPSMWRKNPMIQLS